MTCHQIQPFIVELGRSRVNVSPEVDSHLRTCEACAALYEQERTLSAGLRRLAQDLEEPPDREAALLAAFDAVWQRPPSSSAGRIPVVSGLAAAAIILALVLAGRPGSAPQPAQSSAAPDDPVAVEASMQVAVDVPADSALVAAPPAPVGARQRIGRQATAVPAVTEFVPWPDAAAWPPFESGELIRVEVTFDGGVVEADVLVGQDGFARAIRLVQ